MMELNPKIEYASPEEQERAQVEGVRKTLDYLLTHSPYYQKKLKEAGLDGKNIQRLSDLNDYPLTEKEDIQLYNPDFFCVPIKDIAEYTASSGTLGKPVTVALSKKDIERLAWNEALSFAYMDVKQDDVIQLMLTLDRQFMAGMAYYQGAMLCGATTIRTGPSLPSMQLEISERLGSTIWVAVPSFVMKIKEYARDKGIDLNQLAVRKILCIGEPIRDEEQILNSLGQAIVSDWNIQLFGTYASTEMQTAFTECSKGQGMHHHPDLLLVEIIDEQGQQVSPGEYGEVCISHIGVEAMPLFRYRTGDICRLDSAPCTCGRTSDRLSPVKGRKKQMIKYKGTTLYPPAVFEILNQSNVIKDYVVEVKDNAYGMDEMVIHLNTHLPVDECEKTLVAFLQSRLRVIPELHYISSAEMQQLQFPPGARKVVRFIDHRKSQHHA
jgi:phenylacetate-CoA ligase